MERDVDGWRIEVETEAGVTLYIVATRSALEAEAIVMWNLAITDSGQVRPGGRVSREIVARFGLRPGEMKGPM